MVDIPIPDNQSIIIFSATGGGEGGRVRQNIAFSALTAITLTGGVETDFVRITTSGSSFTAVAKSHKAFGETTFTATATTAGDEERNLEGVAVSFSFRVLVLGVDFPHLVQSFFEFRVGEAVSVGLNIFFAAPMMQLNIPKVQSAIVSQTYGSTHTETDGNLTWTVWDGEPSGVSMDPVLDEYNYVRGASLTGIAIRPGIYYRPFGISSYDTGGVDPFPGANGCGILIINIYDDRESPKIIVPHEHTPDPDFVRVIRHSIAGDTASRLAGEFARSSDIWTRRAVEAVSATVSDVWEYQIAASAGVWTLSGREYLSDETAPAYSTLATAYGRFGEVPPNTGWSGGVLCAGDAAFFVENSGFFDWKGTRSLEVEGQEEPFTGDVYEQQPVVAVQHAGWSNPPATQFDSGLYLAPSPDGKWRSSTNPLSINGPVATPKTIDYAAIPYHPPTAAPAIGGVNYRDLALLIERTGAAPVAVNAHLPHESGGMSLRMGKYVAAVPAHYTFLRQLPPPMAAGTPKNITVTITIESSTPPNESYSDQHACQRGLTQGYSAGLDVSYEFKNWNNESGEKKVTQAFQATIPADAWMRSSPDMLAGLIGMIIGDSSAMTYQMDGYNTRTYGSSNYQSNWVGPNGEEHYSRSTSVEAPTGEPGTQTGRVLMALGSGRNESDATVCLYAAGMAEASGSMETERNDTNYTTTTYYYTDGTSSTTVDDDSESSDGPYTRSMAAGMVSPMCHRISMSDLLFSGLTIETVSASFTGGLEQSRTYYLSIPAGEPGAPGYDVTTTSSTTVTATHAHTRYNGDDLPPGLIGRGWTHVIETIDGVTTDTWHDDPNGTFYAGLYKDYGGGFDFGAIVMPEVESDRRSGSRRSWRNESYTKRTESFSG